MNGEKTVLLIKKEFIVPEFWIFCSLNNFYFDLVINLIKKIYKKNPGIKIIADAEFFHILDDNKIPYKRISEYIPKKYENTYAISLKLFYKWFTNKSLNELKYKQYLMKQVIEQEFAYAAIDYLNTINTIDYILKKENPRRVIVLNDNTLFGNACKEICGQRGISFNFLVPSLFSKPIKNLDNFFRNYSLIARFSRIPIIKRKEFIKTLNRKIVHEEFILFNTPDDVYYSKLYSIINEAKSRKIKVKCIINDIRTQKKAINNNIDFFSVGDFFIYSKELKLFRKKLKNKWKEFIEYVKKKPEIFYYKNLNIFPIIKDYFRYLFKTRFLWCAYYIEAYEELFKNNKIKAIIVMDDLIPINRSLVLVAKKYNVPSLVAPHGVSIDNAGRGFYPLTADKMAVWGKIMKKQLVKRGINPDRLVITGSYIFDKIIKKKILNKDLYEKFGIKKDDFVILLATQKYDDVFCEKELEMILEATIKASKRIPNSKIIITLHPRLDPYIHESILRKYNLFGKVPIDQKTDINALLSISNVLISLYSTIIFNAILYEKPIISLNLMKRPEIFPIVKSKVAIGVSNEKGLVEAIEKTMNKKYLEQNKKYQKRFIKDYCYKIDNNSSKRVINLVMKMAKRKGNHYTIINS